MCINPNLYLTVLLSAVFYFIGIAVRKRMLNGKTLYGTGTALLILCVPALSFSLYYLHMNHDN